MQGIRDLDIIAEDRGLVKEERMSKVDISKKLEKIFIFEEVSWRQKSKALWLVEGG